MPVKTVKRLLGEVDAWPAGLLDPLPEGPWTIAHVKPRQEKLLASNLRRFGLPSVLFLERRVRRYVRQGEQTSMVPLLPGYLFINVEPSAHDTIYSTDRVVRLITVHRPAELHRDLIALAALVARADAPMIVRPELTPGMVVELRAGSMAGLRGVINRRKGRCELVVNVHMLGTSVAVTCSAEDVQEPLPVPDAVQ